MSSSSFDDLPPGTKLGSYVLGEPLGHGGMGTVYSAHLSNPNGLRVQVAVKVLRPQADVSSAEQLVQEACIGGLASHPNVVAALDLGHDEGRWYIVMEYVDGVSAHELRKRGALPTSAALDLIAQAAAGLGYFHALEGPDLTALVHGDIKPHNLLIDRAGLVRVADFGVAAASGSSPRLGTPNYMAPEQWEGRSEQASDIFALGLVLYILLFGQRLASAGGGFPQGSKIQSLLISRRVEERGDALVDGLGGLLMSMLARNPSRRPDAMEVAATLRRLALQRPGVSLASLIRLPSPSMVKPRTPLMVGRSDELERLSRAVEVDDIVCITGPAGVGKTRLVRGLPGIDLFVDLTHCSRLEHLLERVARPLGAHLPTGAGVQWLVSALRGSGKRRFVFDGADGVSGFIEEAFAQQPSGFTVLITCRSQLSIGRSFPLEPLDLVSAMELYIQLSGTFASSEILSALVQTLDRLPLAIELAAASGSEPSVLLADLKLPFGVLRETGGMGSETLYAALDRSWTLLGRRQRNALMGLSVFRGRPMLEDVRAVLGEEGGLDEVVALLQRNLVVAYGDRIGLLTSVRVFAEQKRGRVRDLWSARHGIRFAQRGTPAALEALKRASGAKRLRDLLEDEPEIDAALARSLQQRAPEAGLLALAKMAIVLRHGPMEAALGMIDDVISFVEEPSICASLMERKARVLERQGQNQRALKLATRAYKLAPADAKGVRADCRRRAGLCLLRLGDVVKARKVTRAALVDAERGGDALRAGEVHLNLSLVEAMEGDRAGEVFHQEAARRLAESMNYSRLCGYVYGNIGQRKSHAGDLRGAVQAVETALTHLIKAKDWVSYQNTRGVLAGLIWERGELDRAAEIFEDILVHSRRQCHDTATVRYGCLLAGLEIERGQNQRGYQLLKEAESYSETYTDNTYIHDLMLAKLYIAENRPKEALQILSEEEVPVSKSLLAHAHVLRGMAYLQLHQPRKALAKVERMLAAPISRPALQAELKLLRIRGRLALGLPHAEEGLDEVADFIEAMGLLPTAWLYRQFSSVRELFREG